MDDAGKNLVICVGLLLNGAGIETKQGFLLLFPLAPRVGLLLNGAGIETPTKQSASMCVISTCGPAP